jgi:transketolase
MRRQLPLTVEEVLKVDNKLVLLFGDVGTYGFRFAQAKFPDRVYNVGILEQSMMSMAAGLAMQGFIPVVHTISAFLVERAFEQIKNDFGYQGLGGNFIGTGVSYDMVSWGCTHQCPADVGVLKNIPGMEIVVPGTPAEFDSLFKQSYRDGRPTYFRMSFRSNAVSHDVVFGKALVVKTGARATVIAVGPMRERVEEACKDLDVTILYYTTVAPFDGDTLRENLQGGKLFVCEPYYSGACAVDIAAATGLRPVAVTYIGIPLEFPHHYGTLDELDAFFRLTADDIRTRMKSALRPL